MIMKINKINKLAAMMVIALAPSCVTVAAEDADTTKVNLAFRQKDKQDLLGGVDQVDIKELIKKDYNQGSLDGLQSLVGGYSGTTWQQWPLVLVDGMPRDASKVDPTQIENITVMKAASAVILYGSRASKGAILITTKRGEAKPMSIDLRVNSGLYVPKSYPQYLNAAEYMTYYNQACENDGLKHKYDDATIYNTAAGTDPDRYPDLKYYNDDNLRKVYNKTEVIGEVSGGSEKARYYANFGARYNNGLIKVGDHKNDNNWKFNVTANVDLDITDWLTASTNVGVIVEDAYTSRGDFWGEASSLRPNWYNPLLPIDRMDLNNLDIQNIITNANYKPGDKYLLGGLSTNTTSMYGDANFAGYIRDKYRDFMFKIALDADLSMITKGLRFRTAFDIDYWDYYSEGYKLQYAVYEPTWANMNGKDMIVGLKQYNKDQQTTSEFVGSSSDSQTMMFSAQFDYNRTFNKYHNVAATLVGWGFQIQKAKDADHGSDDGLGQGSDAHRTSNVNLGLNLDYNFAHQYYAQVGLSLVHSAKMPENNRDALSHSFALGWRLSKEKFMQNVKWIDNLKLSAAYSNIYQDLDVSQYYMYKATYNYEGTWQQWADGKNGGWYNLMKQGGNDDMKMINRKEWRVNLEGSLFNRFVTFDINLYTQDTNGLLARGSATTYPSYYNSLGSFLPYINFNADRRQGIDYNVTFNKKVGEVEASLGFVGGLAKNKALIRDENNGDNPYLNRQGQSLYGSWAYVCEGYFKDQADIDAHAEQKFGEVKPGDLKYKDINEDGIVDDKDQVNLGNGTPTYYYGMNLTLKWKNFTFFARGTGQAGGIGYKNSSYYWINGEKKYSEVVLGAWTPETAATATYPRLTTTGNDNNFRNSTYWQYSTNYFKLDKVQVTYDMPSSWFENKIVKGMSLYLSGSDLLTIAKERKHMEMSLGSPQCRFYNLGATIKF